VPSRPRPRCIVACHDVHSDRADAERGGVRAHCGVSDGVRLPTELVRCTEGAQVGQEGGAVVGRESLWPAFESRRVVSLVVRPMASYSVAW
jgi:hypothetical protein